MQRLHGFGSATYPGATGTEQFGQLDNFVGFLEESAMHTMLHSSGHYSLGHPQ